MYTIFSGSKRTASGTVLLVSLILLMVMTLIGVAVIDTSVLQSQMARNSQHARNLYQKSLSEIEAQYELLKGSAYLKSVITAQPDQHNDDRPTKTFNDSEAITWDADAPYSQSVANVFVGDGPPPTGYTLDIYIGKNIEVHSRTEIPGSGSASDQTQGLVYPAPRVD